MGRRVVQLTGDDAERLPAPCDSCVFWELGGPCPEPRSANPLRDPARARSLSDPAVRKQAWMSAQVQDGAPPGRLVLLDDAVVAYALFAPAESFARLGAVYPRVDRDAVLLASVWVHPVHRGLGLGRLLVQAAIKDALRLERPAVEAFGDRRWRDRSCLLPATWLLHEGFEVHREHPRVPLFRVDVRRTVRWAGSLEHAWEEVLGRLPRRAPAPQRVPTHSRSGPR